MENEYENAVSDPILQVVSSQTGESIKFLRASVHADPVRGTDFIKITAYHDDRAKAVIIANTVAETYVERRTAKENDRVRGAVDTLDAELKKQSDMVQDRREAIRVFLQEYGLDFIDDASGKPLSIAKETLPKNRDDVIDHSIFLDNHNLAREQYLSAREKLTQMKTKQKEVRELLSLPRKPVTIHEPAK